MPETIWSLIGMLAVVALVLALAWWSTRWIASHGLPGAAGAPRAGGGNGFRVLGQFSVGRNERLVLVALREKRLLLGVTEHRITVLSEWEGGAPEEEGPAEQPASPSFLDALRENLQKQKRQ